MSQNMKSFLFKLGKRAVQISSSAVLLVSMAGAALGQTSTSTTQNIPVGSGMLSFTETVNSNSCTTSNGKSASFTTYNFSEFSYLATGAAVETATGTTAYSSPPHGTGGDCPTTSGWTLPNPLTLTFPGYVISFTASISGVSSATIQSVTLGNPTALISCSPNPVTFGTSTSCTTSVSGGATGTVNWTINGSPWTSTTLSGSTASAPGFAGSAAGSYTIGASYTGDANNNPAIAPPVTLTISKATPVVTASCSPNPITFGSQNTTCTAQVTGNATGTINWTSNGSTWTSSTLSGGTASAPGFSGSAAGTYTIQATYNGDANNAAASSAPVTLTISKATPVVTASCSPNPITFGSQNTTCTAQVTGNATGTINWTSNGSTWTSSTLSGGTASAPGFSGSAAGTYTIQATYNGDANNAAASSAPVTLTISKATPVVTASCSPNPITFGSQNTTCTAQVTGNATGTINWTSNGSTWTSSTLSGGTASAPGFSGSAAGTYTIQATYNGDANNAAASSAPVTLTISKATPVVTASCSPNPITFGSQNTTCTAQVTGNATGTINWTSNGSTWTSSTLSTGTASAPGFAGSAAGTYTIQATYTGDANNATAVANPITLTISKATPVVGLSCSPNPIIYNAQNTTCTATVSGNATGNVSLTINGNNWVTGALVGGALPEKAFLGFAAGSYTIGASYAGDANNAPAIATPITLTISKATPTVGLSCSPNPIIYNAQNTTCTATVSGNATGNVSLTINGNNWVTGALVGGALPEKAFLGIAAGSYTIGASYAGDANNAPAVATPTTLTISKATPTVGLSCSPNPIIYNAQNTTCTATVSGNATGNVSLTINGNNWVTGALVGGALPEKAFLGIAAGSYTIGASYAGDANNATAVATPTTLTISKATPVITWASPGAITPSTPISSTQLNATANVPGSFAYSVATGAVLSNGSYTLTTTFTPTDTTDYTTATKSVNLIVASSPTITWPVPASIPYGTPLGGAQLNATANVPGSFTYSPASGTVLAVGTYTLNATFTPTNTQYASTTTPVSLTVYQATPSIAWTTPADVTKGTSLSATQLNASTTVAGTMTYSPALGTVLSTVGPNILTANFTPKDSTDYATATVHTYLTVTEGTGTWDSGTVALAVNGSTIATATYGKGSTAATVAATLATNASSSLVSVAAVDNALYLESKTAGAGSDYTYSLQTTSYDSAVFSQPSFVYPTLSGSLDGGAALGADSGTNIYSYTVPTGGYDGVGNLLNYSDSSQGSTLMGAWSFSYDNLNRLVGATDNQKGNTSTNYCWSYDSFGNRTTQAGSSAPFSNTTTCTPSSSASLTNTWATYTANNQILATSQSVGGVPYDNAGDVLSDGVTQYLYDAEGRVCASANSLMTSMTGYIYDADGSRVTKGTITEWSCDPGVSGFHTLSDYVLGPTGEQMTEMGAGSSGALAWQHTNVYGSGMLLATYDNDGLHFYVDDPLGSRRAQTDYAGVMEQTCASLPFGDGLNCSGTTQFPTEHHFTGKERDTESGLDYFGARYYASNMGRFSSPDPSGLYYADPANPQSLNLYSYAQNNPLTNVDPNGLDCVYFNNDGNGAESVDHNSNSGECGANGGDWVNGTTQMNQIQYNQASDNFTIRSSDASNSYNTIVNSPGSEQDGAACYGNCSVGYFASSNVDPLNSYAQGVIGGVAQRTGPLLHLGNCAAGALTVGVGSFLGYDPAPGSSDLVKTLREGAEAALVSKGGGASSQGAAAIALEVASAARGVSKPFAMAVGRAAGSAVEKAVPALLIAQAGLAASDAIDEFQSCYP